VRAPTTKKDLEVTDAIVARGLRHSFGDTLALDGVDITVPAGKVLGMLGPNGAGKTTSVRALTTQLRPDEGTATVLGIDVMAEPERVRHIIGMAGQYAAVDERLTGRENLVMISRLNQLTKANAQLRAVELLDRFGLTDAGDRPLRTYSGGMRRRLDLSAALVTRPKVLFLDEPTTGLDPRSRNDLWEVIEELVGDGTTLLLTTQYLEEADRLADNIMVIDNGRVIAEGTGDQLKAQAGAETLVLSYASHDVATTVAATVSETLGDDAKAEAHGLRVEVHAASIAAVLAGVTAAADRAGGPAISVDVRRPTLDDVFLQLTDSTTEVAA
jgi:ABC-2 type transport system ATP-binding protein